MNRGFIKMTESNLRKVIRKQIVQEGLNFNTNEDLALMVGSIRRRKDYVFFRLDKTMDYLMGMLNSEQGSQMSYRELAYSLVYDGMQDHVIGGVQCFRVYNDSHWGASEVKLSAAESGWGPTLYDTVMGEEPRGIMADRANVSKKAYDVWNYYRLYRDDIVKKPLDSKEKQWTEETLDDGWEGGGGKYSISSNPQTHDEFLQDSTCWVFDRDPVPQAATWLRNGEIIEGLLRTKFDNVGINNFIARVMSYTFDYRDGEE